MAKEYVAHVCAYQCPRHPGFITLTLGSPDGGTATRYATGKCCPDQYGVLLREWRFEAPEARDFIDELETLIQVEKDADGR